MDNEKVNIAGSLTIQMIKSVVKTIPGFSVPIDLYDNYQNNIQYNNIMDVIRLHDTKLKMLSDIVIDKLYIQSPVYVRDLLLTIQKAKDELNSEKRKVYATYLTACCRVENQQDKNKELYLDYVGRIDFLDFYILSKMGNLLNGKKSLFLCHAEFNEEFKTDYSIQDIKIHFDHLTSLGLIERCDKEEYENFMKRRGNIGSSDKTFKSMNLYQKTALGKALFEFIKRGKQ